MKRRINPLVRAVALLPSSLLFSAFALAQTAVSQDASSPAPDQVLAAAPPSPPLPRFAQEIAPVFAKHCAGCHSGPRPTGDLSLKFQDENEVRQKASTDRDFWGRVAGMLTSKEMPPEDAPTRLSDDERALLIRWIYSDVLAINCSGEPNPGRFMVRRLNNREFANTVRDLLYLPADWDASADFPADERGVGFDNNSDTLTVSPVLIEHYIAAAEKAVNFAMNNHGQGSREAQRKLNAPRAEYREDFADWQAEARVVIELFAPRAYRRPVTKREIDELMRFAAVSFAHDGESIDAASSLAMRAALLSPNFLFRLEREPSADGTGKVFQISEFELASRLSYFLWASMPDDELFQAAREGRLRATLPQQIQRMLKDQKAI
jgi:cytochrome c5